MGDTRFYWITAQHCPKESHRSHRMNTMTTMPLPQLTCDSNAKCGGDVEYGALFRIQRTRYIRHSKHLGIDFAVQRTFPKMDGVNPFIRMPRMMCLEIIEECDLNKNINSLSACENLRHRFASRWFKACYHRLWEACYLCLCWSSGFTELPDCSKSPTIYGCSTWCTLAIIGLDDEMCWKKLPYEASVWLLITL